MGTVKITRAKSGGAALDYAEGKDKFRAEARDWLKEQGVDPQLVDSLQDRAVVKSGVEIVDMDYVRGQMRATREVHGKQDGTQAMRVIQSFGADDFNAADPDDWQKCNQVGRELAERIAPNHEVAVYTHIDGEGHKLHNHIVINMPDIDTGIKYHHNEDWQRVAGINDEIAREHGLSLINPAHLQHDRRSLSEIKMAEAGKYVWKDDLRDRINRVMKIESVMTFGDFELELKDLGVTIDDRGKDWTYHLDDHKSRGKTLGSSYGKETIQDELAGRQQLLPDMVRTTDHARNLQRGAEPEAEPDQALVRGAQTAIDRSDELQLDAHSELGRGEEAKHKTDKLKSSASRGIERVKAAIDRLRTRITTIAREATERLHSARDGRNEDNQQVRLHDEHEKREALTEADAEGWFAKDGAGKSRTEGKKGQRLGLDEGSSGVDASGRNKPVTRRPAVLGAQESPQHGLGDLDALISGAKQEAAKANERTPEQMQALRLRRARQQGLEK